METNIIRRQHGAGGWLSHGKMVIYPIRSAGADGLQLVNWVAEIETPNYLKRDWNRRGSIEDFIGAFADWHFDWLDVPAFIRAADSVLEFPDGRSGSAAALEFWPAD